MRIFLAFIIPLLLSTLSFSQEKVTGIVQDAETGKAVPYVNIGIISLMKGTVSNAEGKFSLGYTAEIDSVTFSAIGYETDTFSIKDILADEVILLNPATYNLDEITVKEKALGRIKELGYNLNKKRQSISFGSTLLGTEIGGLIEIDRQTLIYSAHFIFNHTGDDSLLFRVNLYEMNGDKPVRNLITENELFRAPKEPGTVLVNLRGYDIVTEENVLLTVEWIEAVSLNNSEIQDISFRADRTMRKPNTWFRTTSQAPLLKMDQFVKYNIGFYLTAQQVKK
ncbi:carboxypeptidase-like regulatory domain-containing protein [Gracilimonas sp.]|uniref:carboxypeptidase-like regulatory domain-containing protein n=1 Tax=Gracilimonas sp. TaxID=1974203 RepID=UPI0032EF640B